MQANETISDCNNAVNGRAYNFINTALHKPSFNYGTLFQIGTMANGSSYKMQIACDVVDNHFAFRKTPNDSWGNEPWNELALNGKVTWKKLDGTQTHLNGSDKLTYPVGATEIFIREGETYTECIQIPITAISSGDSYWYTKSRAFHINKTNRQVWCYAKEGATECYTILYYR